MGGYLSRGDEQPTPTKVVRYVPYIEAGPLTTLEELLEHSDPMLCFVEPLNVAIRRGSPEDPKTLFCHDMMGGYHEDRRIHGSHERNQYRFHHWHTINTFVYYTHNLVTIPPPSWITAAHRHGVKVLGTFMLESSEGVKIINAVKNSGLVHQVAEKLACLAARGRFDGWLVSIGCKVHSSSVSVIKDLLAAITEKTHSAVPGSLVIWYDGVDTLGKARPHNELNTKNFSFFELCDGIFLHFCWTEDLLQKSAQLAGCRKADVYAGIDVFGRGTAYHGGYEMVEAVKTVRQYGLSAAVFGAGWVYEMEKKKKFIANQCRLWDFPDNVCPETCFTAPPISTSFCQGFGDQFFSAGAVVFRRPWFNLSKQQLQPRDQGNKLHKTSGSVTVYLPDAYNGGGCLRVLFRTKEGNQDEVPYFRLFICDFPLGSLAIRYTFKLMNEIKFAGQDMTLVLKVKCATGETEELLLGTFAVQPEGNNYVLRRELDYVPHAAPNHPCATWATRRYYVEDKRGAEGVTLREIGVLLSCCGHEPNVCLLGQLDVTRPKEDRKHNDRAAQARTSTEDVGYQPKEKRPRLQDLDDGKATAD